MTDWSPDAQMWFRRSLPELKTVADVANSWKSERPLSVESHVKRMVKGRFPDSMVDEKCPFGKGVNSPIKIHRLTSILRQFVV